MLDVHLLRTENMVRRMIVPNTVHVICDYQHRVIT